MLKLQKKLQLGPEKCKTMIVSKRKVLCFQKPELEVDEWKLEHEPNGDVKEYYNGKIKIENKNTLVHLGHVLSRDGRKI